MKLKYNSPESVGIPSELILNFHKRVIKKSLSLHSTIVYAEGSVISETYFSPFKKDDLHRMFSIAKTVVALAVGVLCDKSMLSLEDKIADYFPEKLPENPDPSIKELTIRNMLMMRTCHAVSTYDKFDLTSDWVGSFFTKKPTHKGGTVFHYDTSAAHVLGALVEKLTGMKVWDFVRFSFKELEFSEKSHLIPGGQGVSHGGSGLVATTEDILKLGILLLNEGNIDGKQLISREFVKEATSNLTPNCVGAPLPSESCGYGYFIWRTERDGFVLYGMGGQLVIADPSTKIILVTTTDTQGYAGANQIIYDAFYEEIIDISRKLKGIPTPDGNTGLNMLREFEQNARMGTVITELSGTSMPTKTIDRTYMIKDNPSCIESLSITHDLTIGCLTLRFKNGSTGEIPFGFSDNKEGILPLYGDRIISSAAYISENTLYIRLRVIGERVGSVHFEIYFEDKEITVYMKKIEETDFNEYNGHLQGFLMD